MNPIRYSTHDSTLTLYRWIIFSVAWTLRIQDESDMLSHSTCDPTNGIFHHQAAIEIHSKNFEIISNIAWYCITCKNALPGWNWTWFAFPWLRSSDSYGFDNQNFVASCNWKIAALVLFVVLSTSRLNQPMWNRRERTTTTRKYYTGAEIATFRTLGLIIQLQGTPKGRRKVHHHEKCVGVPTSRPIGVAP